MTLPRYCLQILIPPRVVVNLVDSVVPTQSGTLACLTTVFCNHSAGLGFLMLAGVSVFALPVYLLLGLVCVLVVLETCCELPQMKRLARRFNHENVRELDSETANIIDLDHTGGRLSDHSDPVMAHHPPAIPSVSEQAASLRQDKSVPYTPVPGSAVNGNLR